MVRQHHGLSGHESKQTPGDSEGHVSLACCSPWDRRVRHDLVTEQLYVTLIGARSQTATWQLCKLDKLFLCQRLNPFPVHCRLSQLKHMPLGVDGPLFGPPKYFTGQTYLNTLILVTK